MQEGETYGSALKVTIAGQVTLPRLVHEVQIFRRLSRSNGCIDFGARWRKSVEDRSSREFDFDLKVWWWGYGDTACGHGTPMVMGPHLALAPPLSHHSCQSGLEAIFFSFSNLFLTAPKYL